MHLLIITYLHVGKIFLVNAGYILKGGLITPFRGESYHIKEYSVRNLPRIAHELFNHQHSSLQNAVERVIGILKKRFPILESGREPPYNV